MCERLIVHRPRTVKEAIKSGRLLEVANRTACGAASPNLKGVFAALPTANATQMTNQATNRAYNGFNQQANFKPRGTPNNIQASTVPSYNSGYVTPNGPPQRRPMICYICGKPGHNL